MGQRQWCIQKFCILQLCRELYYMDRLVLLKGNTSPNFLKVIWKLRKVSRTSCLWNSEEIPAITSPVEFLFIEAGSNMLSIVQNSCSKKLFKKLSVFPLKVFSVNVTRKLRICSHLLKNPKWKTSFLCAVSVLKKDSTMVVLGSLQIFSEQLFLSKH